MLRSLPNALTVLRMASAPAGAVLMILSYGSSEGRPFAGIDLSAFQEEADALALAAMILFVLGALTDMFDGWLARALNAVTRAGALLDPIADKVFVAFWLFVWVWILPFNLMIVVPAAAIIARDIMLTVIRLQRLGQESVPIPVRFDAKMKTTAEFITLALPFLAGLLAVNGIGLTDWFFIEIWMSFLWFSAALSLYTAIRYLLPRKRA
ncbi:CDP-alcohol phosphatidyltransferase family protein [Hyphobacterium sp. SN044]|uniref:CDP-alcohol phosphatidyltransferase family protein n=1 Tax=Hyphobacterium sp. SN044 TaxID=2912575 RepID=UPI001F3A5C2A|nr:CDP-alcohol phosphatidyltransferase family protein [Hyphobacterium sp. SN044]MCF8878277.1 CDP-alcohol phosphatidyltransferase family protein [Hyphobacterium sp. SN044]